MQFWRSRETRGSQHIAETPKLIGQRHLELSRCAVGSSGSFSSTRSSAHLRRCCSVRSAGGGRGGSAGFATAAGSGADGARSSRREGHGALGVAGEEHSRGVGIGAVGSTFTLRYDMALSEGRVGDAPEILDARNGELSRPYILY